MQPRGLTTATTQHQIPGDQRDGSLWKPPSDFPILGDMCPLPLSSTATPKHRHPHNLFYVCRLLKEKSKGTLPSGPSAFTRKFRNSLHKDEKAWVPFWDWEGTNHAEKGSEALLVNAGKCYQRSKPGKAEPCLLD